MRHIEFIHSDHFEKNYHRVPPPNGLNHFIDFFWETKFEHLWKKYPTGFSDAQFPNIGYTNIINLGTPFVMQVDEKKFNLKTDGFLPRHHAIECFHKPGNHLFGIKFRISPIVFEKKVNFSEYNGHMYPLSYLLDQTLINHVKKTKKFEVRVSLLSDHFLSVLKKNNESFKQVNLVSSLLNHCFNENNFSISIDEVAEKNNISVRTLQRYFENCTGISCKQALQVMRIRKAVAQIIKSPADFHYSLYGFYDHSHFYKHLKSFFQKSTFKNINMHLPILTAIHK